MFFCDKILSNWLPELYDVCGLLGRVGYNFLTGLPCDNLLVSSEGGRSLLTICSTLDSIGDESFE